ncbi:MAG TPA: HlyD family secretion protein [Acetobacteraceae bacterium]|nr:HlyD family secretion protein [Acetobacteraceae bacterium]
MAGEEQPGGSTADQSRRPAASGAAPQAGNAQAQPSQARAEAPPEQRPNRGRSGLIRLIFLIVVLVAVAAGGWYYYSTRNLEGTDDAFTDGNVVTIAPHVAGYVTALAVTDNQYVKAGDVLIRIDPRDFVAARDQAAGTLAVAQGQLAGAEAGLERARVTFPAQLTQAQGQLIEAEGQLYKAQTDYKRQHSIARAATTQESVDTSTANLRQAEGQVKVAQAQVQEATPVPQNIAQSKAQADQLTGSVREAKARLDQAELNLGYTVVRAPQDGWVTRRNVNVGDYVQPGQAIMSLVTTKVWITANFKETQLDRIRPGQRVDVHVDAYPSLKLLGHIDSIQRGSGSRFSAFPAENATGNFVKIVQRVPVKIDIDSGLQPDVALPLGLSVEPTVHLDGTRSAGQ